MESYSSLSLSLVLSDSTGLGGLRPRSRTWRCGCWESDGKPDSLSRGVGFVGRLCCGPSLTGGTVGGRCVVWGPDGKPGPL